MNFGLPHVYHQDEAIVVNHALAVGVEGWNTRTYLPPQFASYALFFVYAFFYAGGHLFGIFPGPSDFALAFLTDPAPFYLLGRLFLGAAFGTATVLAVHRLGRFFSGTCAVLAALFLAVDFLHVQHSHYIYMDIALTLATTLLFCSMLEGLGRPSWKNAAAQGLLFGWAVAAKYTAVYFFPVIALAFFLAEGRSAEKIKRTALAGALSVAAYAAISPYSFLDWSNFISQVKGQSGARGFSGPFHHLTYSLAGGVGILFLLTAAAGLALLLKERDKKGFVLAAGAVLYYLVNVFFSQSFARYMMPLVPVLCVTAAFAVERILKNGRNRPVKYAFLALMLLEMLVPTVYSDYLFTTEDTRTECLRWFDENAAGGSGVAVDNRFFGPRLTQSAEQIREKYASFPEGEPPDARKKRLDLQQKAIEKKKTYRVFVLFEGDKEDPRSFMFLRPFVRASREEFESKGIRYLVLNYSEIHPGYHALKSVPGWELKTSFSPFWDPSKKEVSDKDASTAAPHLLPDLLSRRRLGPYLEVYEWKQAGASQP